MAITPMDAILTKLASEGAGMPAAREAHYSGQLEKIARVVSGVNTPGESFSIEEAVKALGKKLYIKRAEHRLIAAGLEALRSLEND